MLDRVGHRLFATVLYGGAMWGCAPTEPAELTSKSQSSIIGGHASGDDENAAILVSIDESGSITRRCSGRLIAPNLAVTARHCVVRTLPGSSCTADGAPKDLATAGDLTLAPNDQILVEIGSDRASLRRVEVRQVLTATAVSVCTADIAFIVLAEAALDVRTPIRREPVRIGETFFVSGWGLTSADMTAPPARRSTLDAVSVTAIGPGLVPVGSFASGGASVCFGDSGAGALIDGALVGVYSRIEGNCDAQSSTNVFSGLLTESDLVERAFAAIGEKPLYTDIESQNTPDASTSVADASAPVPEEKPHDDGCATAWPRHDQTDSHPLIIPLALGVLFAYRRRQRPCLRISL